MQQGSTGPAVVLLQSDLNKFGYGLLVDGEDGPITTAAVKDYQSNHALVIDGIVGPITWHSLGE